MDILLRVFDVNFLLAINTSYEYQSIIRIYKSWLHLGLSVYTIIFIVQP